MHCVSRLTGWAWPSLEGMQVVAFDRDYIALSWGGSRVMYRLFPVRALCSDKTTWGSAKGQPFAKTTWSHMQHGMLRDFAGMTQWAFVMWLII